MKKYTSGSFTATKYTIYKEDTDTITSFPAEIIADGESASALVYGNMQQTGTPTPTNPIQPQECGDLETTGEHTGQYKIPISSANTTTPVYLGEVQTTRKIIKLVLTGEETWGMSGNIVYITNFGVVNQSPLICTHFTNEQNTGMWNGNTWVFQVDISKHGMTTKTEWLTYLQQQYATSTPVTVWYVLVEPTTGIVNEPLRKIGDYADEVSGITIPTVAAADNINVTTTLKPSAMDLTYTGWHKYDDKKRSGGAWT